MIPFMGETVCRAFNLVFIPVFLLYIYIYIYIYINTVGKSVLLKCSITKLELELKYTVYCITIFISCNKDTVAVGRTNSITHKQMTCPDVHKLVSFFVT